MPWLNPSVVPSPATTPGGSSVVDDAAVVLRPTAEKEAVDEAAVRKAVKDAAAVERATVDKKVANVAMTKKVDSVYHSSPLGGVAR
jgi:hypothetical protein